MPPCAPQLASSTLILVLLHVVLLVVAQPEAPLAPEVSRHVERGTKTATDCPNTTANGWRWRCCPPPHKRFYPPPTATGDATALRSSRTLLAPSHCAGRRHPTTETPSPVTRCTVARRPSQWNRCTIRCVSANVGSPNDATSRFTTSGRSRRTPSGSTHGTREVALQARS